MTSAKTASIKKWIRFMGFKLAKSHRILKKSTKINYYTLGNFGVYEELPLQNGRVDHDKPHKFITWNPWGVDVEINSVRDLSEAYQDSVAYNPELSVI
ncbi:hypothetical protein GS399_08225 [Pedobacter sp. HMF7647]|uniref:Uncharacterized protein n=1 Tax=Hufsiella arboris TaxID=2695275 RepID=A0A7K1Y8P6_9SPHI|nr:hypothetical protein [Hufsiella arboris]MXV50956.1 hypothetical protein [Hufsiella arboris]